MKPFMGAADGWRVDLDADNEAVRAAVAHDPAWNSYFLSDLEPPFRSYTRIALARGEGSAFAALLVIRHPSFTHAIASGDAAGVAAILALTDLPPETNLYMLPEHVPAFADHFDLAPGRQMLLMTLTPGGFRPRTGATPAVRLGVADVPALLDLYAGYDEGAFTPDALQAGVFYGVLGADRILAAGGTHAVTPRHGVATVGSIFTRPEERGRGYAGAVTSAVVAELISLGLLHVNLSVAAVNAPAIAVYRGLGFREHCTFREAYARRL